MPEDLKVRLEELDGIVSESIRNWARSIGAKPTGVDIDEITTNVLERVLEALEK